MTNLNTYLDDGANKQARAVMCLLQGLEIEETYDPEHHFYQDKVKIGRWENCREQGYVVILRCSKAGKQLNIAFFEHRNSDSICALKWEQRTINSPTIEIAQFGEVYKDKYDVSHEVQYGQISKMSDWIETELRNWYRLNLQIKPN